MTETPLEKLIGTLCDTSDLTAAEVREELAAEGVDVDAAKARFMPKLDELMRARAVRLALAALKANPFPFASPLLPHGWASMHTENDFFEASCTAVGGRDAIIAAVNAAPVLAAEVERLQGLLATQTATVEAARAILLALCGQSPACGDTVETLARRAAGEFEAARVAVAEWVPIHANDCAGWCIDEHAASMALEGCDCGMADEDIACRSARRAVGLEG